MRSVDEYFFFFVVVEVELDPLRTFCPEVGCETICHVRLNMASDVPKNPDSSASKPIRCPTVSYQYGIMITKRISVRYLVE